MNYLDDFFFASLLKILCDQQIQGFLDVCQDIKFPVSLDKTFWGTTVLTFSGLLLDTERQLICIPGEKVQKVNELIDFFLDKSHKKVTLLQIQQLCGYLNFLCWCVVPGHAFTMRLYTLTVGNDKLRPHHHIKLREENRQDLLVWKQFLQLPNVFCHPFMDMCELEVTEINMYSDASGKIGFGALCKTNWMYGEWGDFLLEKPSIKYLELFAVTAGVLQWIHHFQNSRIILFCDNISAVHMINSSSSKCKNCMILIRLIVLEGMRHNVKIGAKYVKSKENGLSDALSRLDFKHFRKLGPYMEDNSTDIPKDIWPIQQIWLKPDA